MKLQIAIKDLKGALKERTLVSIIVLQLFVALFASVIMFGLLILYNPSYTGDSIEKDVYIGFVGNAPILEGVLKPEKKYNSIELALDDFYNGEIDAIVILASESNTETNIVKVLLPKEEIKAIKSSLLLKERLKEYQYEMRELRGIPANINVKTYDTNFRQTTVPEDISITFKFVYIMLIPLLIVTTAATAAGMFIDLISEEVETKTIYTLLSTPLDKEDIIWGKILSSIILVTVLTPTWVFLLMVNRITIENIPLVILVSISIGLIFLGISALSTHVSRDRERAQLVFSLSIIGLIPLMFTSPISPAMLASRMAAGSPFNMAYNILYFLLGIMLVFVSVKLLKRSIDT